MKSIDTLVIAGAIVAVSLFSTAPVSGQELAEKLAAVVEQASKNGFTGQVVIQWQGREVLNTAIGMADPAAQRPNSPESLFYIGSIAKIITSATVLKLAEEGVLDLDASIENYLPEVPADKQKITLRHLLAHRAGLPANHENPLAMLSADQFVAWVMDQKLAFEPGNGWTYSNVGYSLLAAIIERATDDSFQEVVRNHMLSPAGMKSTYFLDELAAPLQPRLTVGSGPLCDRFQLSGRIVDFEPTWLRYGPGAMVSSATDMAKLCEAVSDGKLYSNAGFKLATTAVQDGWGLGWRLSRTRNGSPLHYHDGGFAGFHALLARMPREDAYVILTSNREKGAEAVAKALLDVLMTQQP